MEILPRDLSVALDALVAADETENYCPAAVRGAKPEKVCPLITVLLPRNRELHLVLDFLPFPDIRTLELLGEQSRLPYLRHVCKELSTHLAEELISASIWNNLVKMKELVHHKHVPATAVAGSLSHGFLTPLAGAAMRGNYLAVEFLLHAGADVNWADERGVTALEMALVRARYQAELSSLDDEASLWKTIQILKLHGGRVLGGEEEESYD